MPETLKRFDAADYLTTEADIEAYLDASAEYDDPAFMAAALETVARARRSNRAARSAGQAKQAPNE